MAVSTAGTYLMYKATEGASSYTKLCDITNYPDLGGSPNKIDITDLSCKNMKKSMMGLQEAPELNFECMYDKEVFKTISALNDSYHFAMYFGDETGVDGKYGWEGKVTVYVNGGGVDEARKMTVVTSAETEITEITA